MKKFIVAIFAFALLIPMISANAEPVPCEICNRTGICQTCEGYGEIDDETCEDCDGTGQCANCNGVGYIEVEYEYEDDDEE